MNQTILSGDEATSDSLEFLKLVCFSLKHSEELYSFIKSIEDSLVPKLDKRYMLKQHSDKTYLWNNEKLKMAWCLTPRDLVNVSYSDTTDYWEEFRKKFGKYGRHRYSKPIFNEDGSLCVIEHSGQGNWLTGSGTILLFKRENENWTLVRREYLWIS
jgi:hypothetical protein